MERPVVKLSPSGPLVPNAGSRSTWSPEPWCRMGLVRSLLLTERVPAWSVSILAFVGYWVVPLVSSAFQGTLVSQASLVRWGTGIPAGSALSGAYRWLGLHQRLSESGGYLEDRTHLLFALVGSLALMVAVTILRRFHGLIRELAQEGLPDGNLARTRLIYFTYRKAANHWATLLLSMLFATMTFALFLRFTWEPTLANWWGSRRFGWGGLSFAAIEAAMVFVGSQVMILSAVASAMLYRLLRTTLQIRPFHPDGANGLDPLGRMVILFWMLALPLGTEVFITFRLGYLGIEKHPLAWMLGLLGMISVPILALAPLFSSVRALQEAKTRWGKTFEPLLNNLLTQAEGHMRSGDFEQANRAMSSLGEIHGVQEMIVELNVWPFNPRALSVVLLVYLFQLYLTVMSMLG